jgi:rare lipoprotein A (peptidoglycan hydrolase)
MRGIRDYYEPKKPWYDPLPNPAWYIPAVIIFTLIFVFLFINLAHAETYLTASWYNRASLIKEGTWKDGKERMMANGQAYDSKRNTCATRLYKLGTILKVTGNGKSVYVKVTDRCSARFSKTRIDLSESAFRLLAPLSQGLLPCKVEEVQP